MTVVGCEVKQTRSTPYFLLLIVFRHLITYHNQQQKKKTVIIHTHSTPTNQVKVGEYINSRSGSNIVETNGVIVACRHHITRIFVKVNRADPAILHNHTNNLFQIKSTTTTWGRAPPFSFRTYIVSENSARFHTPY